MSRRGFEGAGIFCVEDLRRRARKKLPRFVFDFVEGAAGNESTLQRNLDAFGQVTITPRLGGCVGVSTRCKLLGQDYDAPFGIAPLGLADLIGPEADVILAHAAASANIPYICSAAAGTGVEEVIRRTGRVPWFQLYCPRDEAVTNAILSRLEIAGVDVLVITVDVPVPGRRIRDLRNGLALPLRPGARLIADCMLSPQWTMRRLIGRKISFPNFERHMPRASMPFNEVMGLQTGGLLDWQRLQRLREQWPRKLVIKGVLCADDAVRAAKIGADGVIVSNHGGRQFDAAPAAIRCLPSVKKAVPESAVMLDSGIRSGTDVARAIGLGAEIAWIGRPFLYALAAFGEAGPSELIRMLITDFRNVLAVAGRADTNELSSQLLD
ncbi:alpha-hydroxy-acid oxidizing protein [Sphingomonas gei]|uniref:Alpha-hydroxy-acid oxidizing protein n=1 Tax=Sphingomonas gei TaxID=1395960 RepID=A0A4S1WYM2_9SPHN|nr:alpha-hydroxy acid oxidase [Sphingomonas gei]TGX48679.1 alpha-hydroxy-acid oxidizing protein [Sphingomonas gei]